MQVSVPDSLDASEDWWEALCSANQLSQEEQEDMLSMCGIPRLLAALQKLQFEHMLAHHSEMMAKLQSKLQEILPRVKVGWLTRAQVHLSCHDKPFQALLAADHGP